jgi:nucleotide-binding universal stress UspA family protein
VFRSVLVGYDDSHTAQTALRQAIDIARASRAWLQVCFVEDVQEPESELVQQSPTSDEIAMASLDIAAGPETQREKTLDDRGPVLQKAADWCNEEGVPCITRHLFGRFSERIAAVAYLHDLVVVGQSRDVSRGQRHRVGPHIKHLLWNCPVPMLLGDSEYHQPLAATLLYEDNPYGGRALSVTAALCDILDMELHVAVPEGASPDTGGTETELEYALKPYKMGWNLRTYERSPIESIYAANRDWEDRLVVIPRPPKAWPWSTTTIDAVVSLPDAMKIVVP